MGGRRGTRRGPWRGESGRAGHGLGALDHLGRVARTAGTGPEPGCGGPASPSSRRRSPGGHDRRSGRARGAVGADRTHDPRGSANPPALDVQEYAQLADEAAATGSSGESAHRRDPVERRRLQFASEPQDPRGTAHPDRDAQFRYLNRCVRRAHQGGQPAISVDTKKKELVGDFKNGGRTWRPQGQPARVRVHDFLDPTLGKAIPYGVYDLANNQGWVSVGIDHDTAEFAANAIRRWWARMGRYRFPHARTLCDHGRCWRQ